MLILILFAFIGGIVTILSPCILPTLPIVLSGTLTGGKRRPFGIVIGFILSFTVFTLFLSSLVKIFGFSADFLRAFSIVMVFSFGVSLLFPPTQIFMEKIFSRISSQIIFNNNQTAGFGGGIVLGASLGLIWTPCVGPILASIIALAATATVTLESFFITLSYSIGTAIPLLAITYGGRQLLQKNKWLLRNSAKIQKGFGVLMIITALGIFFNIDRNFQIFILQKFPSYGSGLTSIENNASVQNALDNLKKSDRSKLDLTEVFQNKAPEIAQGGTWINSEPLTLEKLKGKVVIVDFWTYTCINCIRTLPFLNAWYDKYKDTGLVIIGVHTPEFAFEKNITNVQTAVLDYKIKYPVVQDNDYMIWNAYQNNSWPAKYFVDKNGTIRDSHIGEGDYAESEKLIQKLLAETGEYVDTSTVIIPEVKIETRSPETYLGYGRMEYLSSPEAIEPDKTSAYSAPQILPNTSFAFVGNWMVGKEYAAPQKGSKLFINFNAKNVYLVMRSKIQNSTMKVTLDGQTVNQTYAGEDVQNGVVTIIKDERYRLINLTKGEKHLLELEFLDNNCEVYAFTFG